MNDQLTGFVETKLVRGIKGEGGRGGRVMMYPQREKQENEDVTRVLIPCPYSPSYHMVAMNTLHALTAASTHTI